MPSELVSLADASALLGVSSERVRQLVVAGDLPGVRFGNAWAVPREAVEARRHVVNRRGRPVSALRAWESIAAGEVDLSNAGRYRNRGEVHRYEMSEADLLFVSSQDGVMVSGAEAARNLGELIQSDREGTDLYVPKRLHGEIALMVAAVPDQLGDVILRVLPDVVQSFISSLELGHGEDGRRLAPRAAVGLDLMESGNPRHWVAAQSLVSANV